MKRYPSLVRAYVMHGREADLAAIGALKDTLIDSDVPIEDLVELHESAMLGLKDLVTPEGYEDITAKTSACLTELLVAHSFADYRKKALRDYEDRIDRERQRLEALGQIAGGVAHEFNNLLQPITGMAELALEDIEPDSELAGQIEIILDCANQAAAITGGVLTAARSQAPEPAPTILAPLVRRTFQFLEAVSPKDLKLDLSITCQDERVLCEEGELAQVLLNLVRNAGDAMNGAGTIHIRLERDEAAGTPAQPQLRLTVADTGEGMSAEVAARAFQAFFTTKPSGQGTGLGLSVVMSIVNGWTGTIDIDTAPGRGTRIIIKLPVHSDELREP